MQLLVSIDQLKIGTKLKIVGKDNGGSDSYGSVSVKKLIKMYKYGSVPKIQDDTEVLINSKKNYYFSFERYISGKSNWVKEVYVLDGIDKRLKKEQRRLNES
jgi:hypothetical protein